MIGHLTGNVIDVLDGGVLLNVQGVGYKVSTTDQTCSFLEQNQTVSLYTHLAVREQALDLYGFLTKQEIDFFELLITISGIGPKGALGILSAADPITLYTAIKKEDATVLTKVSGIGKKNADKIILELQKKVAKFDAEFGDNQTAEYDMEVFEALEALGFDSRSIQKALQEDSLRGLDTSAKIKAAIKLLGK